MTRHILLVVTFVAAAAAPVRADRIVPFLPADKLAKNVKVHAAGTLQPEAVLEISPGAEASTRVIEESSPQAPSHLYVLTGKIKYEGVAPAGYVEMWSHFPGGKKYFSRTLDEQSGPMMKVTGTHNWRDLTLPFQSEPGMLPEKIEVNLVLPSKGTVWISEMKLGSWQAAWSGDGWWGDGQAGWIGAVGGSVLGLLGAAIGTLCGLGVARRVAWTLSLAILLACTATLVAGVIAIFAGQPYHVYFPLLLLGGIGVVVFGLNFPTIRKRYEQIELRKMTALDA